MSLVSDYDLGYDLDDIKELTMATKKTSTRTRTRAATKAKAKPRPRPKPKPKPSVILPANKSMLAGRPSDYILFFYGPPGVGKTTFVNGLADRVLFLSSDRGTRFQEALRIEIHDYETLDRAITALENGDEHYDMVCFDVIDHFTALIETQITKEMGIDSLSDGQWGAGWNEYKKRIHQVIQRILRVGAGVAFISHEKIVSVKTRTREEERYQPTLQRSAAGVIIPLTDIMGYCTFQVVKTKTKTSQRRVLRTQPTANIDAKDRTTARTKPDSGVELLNPEKFHSTFS